MTARIALLSIALALVSNLALVGVVRRQTRSDALDAIRRETVEQADALVAVYRTGGLPAVTGAINDARAPGDTALLLGVFDPRGRRLAGFGPAALRGPPHETAFRLGRLTTGATLASGYELRPIGSDWLLAGRTLDLLAAEQEALERALAVAAAVSLGLGVMAGLVLARYVGRRLNGIIRVIDAAADGDLSRRVGTSVGAGSRDAFDRLAERLDAMLAKVEALMGELRLVTDSLAHDLRSPLARLRARAERAAFAEAGQREAALSGLLAETDLLMRMLTTAIEISRSESVARDRLQPAAPAALVAEIAELYEPAAEEAGLRFALAIDTAPPPMPLHRELLSQAVANLLDNAIKHAAAGGEVTLRLAHARDGVAIAVEDRGPGIAEADRARARSRFGRLDAARSLPGAGLGMALVEAVARLHGGHFELADAQPGLVARIVLPTG